MSQPNKCMKNSYTSCFELKQHTPLIHFKADAGDREKKITIRTTELKPKLDAFLIKRFKEENKPYTDYLKSHNAFHYEVEIIIVDVGSVIPAKGVGSYFGDYKALENQKIIVKIECFIEPLKEMIDKYFEEFISTESFGTRSNKGFGQYLPVDMNIQSFEKYLLSRYGLVYIGQHEVNNPLSAIKKQHTQLKSGENYSTRYRDVYSKSLIFKYFCQNDIRWEKRKIKRVLINDKEYKDKYPIYYDENKYDEVEEYADPINCDDGNNTNEDFRYIRAMLGLADNFEYKMFNEDEKLVIDIYDGQKEVERFPSPISYKVFENKIYIIPHRIPSSMFNKYFSFDLGIKIKNGNKWEKTKIIKTKFINDLRTPTQVEFNLVKFLDYSLGRKYTKKVKS